MYLPVPEPALDRASGHAFETETATSMLSGKFLTLARHDSGVPVVRSKEKREKPLDDGVMFELASAGQDGG